MHAHTHAYIHTYVCTCMHPCTHTCIHTLMHMCMHTDRQKCMHACMQACIHTCLKGAIAHTQAVGSPTKHFLLQKQEERLGLELEGSCLSVNTQHLLTYLLTYLLCLLIYLPYLLYLLACLGSYKQVWLLERGRALTICVVGFVGCGPRGPRACVGHQLLRGCVGESSRTEAV